MSREGALWIGGLEPYMDEEFLLNALRQSGENNVLSIKVVKNKFTGQIAGYGFVNFANDQTALMCMHKLNGKIIPESRPPSRFKLNHNSNRILPGEKNHSIWVGDLDQGIDDLELYKFFSARFQTIVSAKVVLDDAGGSKGFGFVRFGDEIEQQTALTTMQGISGLGTRPIKVSIAVQKAKDPSQMQPAAPPYNPAQAFTQTRPANPGYPSGGGGSDYNQYYNQYNHYWSNMAAWQQYNQYYQGYPGAGNGPQPPVNPPLPPNNSRGSAEPTNGTDDRRSGTPQRTNGTDASTALKCLDEESSIFDGPLNQQVEHSKPIDYYKLNRLYFSSSADLYDSMEESGWVNIRDDL